MDPNTNGQSNVDLHFEDRFTDKLGEHTFKVEKIDDNKYLVWVDRINLSELERDGKLNWLENGIQTEVAKTIGEIIDGRLRSGTWGLQD